MARKGHLPELLFPYACCGAPSAVWNVPTKEDTTNWLPCNHPSVRHNVLAWLLHDESLRPGYGETHWVGGKERSATWNMKSSLGRTNMERSWRVLKKEMEKRKTEQHKLHSCICLGQALVQCLILMHWFAFTDFHSNLVAPWAELLLSHLASWPRTLCHLAMQTLSEFNPISLPLLTQRSQIPSLTVSLPLTCTKREFIPEHPFPPVLACTSPDHLALCDLVQVPIS